MPRLDGIKKNIGRLRQLGELSFERFASGDSFDLAQHHLRLALEGVFHIGSHILSRLPGSRAVEYREIAVKLGELKVVEVDFAERTLVPMARLRNLLVHHYADIDAQVIYRVVHENLDDIETFLSCVKRVLEHPDRWNLGVQ